jgi:hypothetical protein
MNIKDQIEIRTDGIDQWYGYDDEFCYMWYYDRIYVGVRSAFDRWANSRDFVLYRPEDRIDLDVLKAACRRAQAMGYHDDSWPLEYDIAGEYRAERRGKTNGNKQRMHQRCLDHNEGYHQKSYRVAAVNRPRG